MQQEQTNSEQTNQRSLEQTEMVEQSAENAALTSDELQEEQTEISVSQANEESQPNSSYDENGNEQAQTSQERTKKPSTTPSDEWWQNDSQKFQKDFPDNNLKELLEDADFLKYAQNRVGVDSMSDIYSDYQNLIGSLKEKATKQAMNQLNAKIARSKASPGSLTATPSSSYSEFYSIDEIRKMTPQEIDKNWDKVQRSIKRATK